MMTETATRTVTLNQYLNRENQAPAEYGQFEVELPGPFHNIDEMERANIASGCHYFDASAKRFFRSRIHAEVFHGRFFIDSIQFVSSRGEKADRQYKIRAVLDGGQTSSVIARDRAGNWTEDFPSLDSAHRALARLLQENA